MNLLGLKLDFSYPLNSKFRSLARNKYTSDVNEIHKKYAQGSLHKPKIILIQKDYHINFDVEQKRPLLLARSVRVTHRDSVIMYLV